MESVSRWFKREVADVKGSVDRMEDRLELDLARKERTLAASPEERMAMIQDDRAADDALAAIRDKIDGSRAQAGAEAELLDDPGSETE